MSNITYYLAWLGAGLVLVAVASAFITRQLRLRVMRRVKAAELLDALAVYSGWVAAQRRLVFFQGEAPEDDSPLQEVRAIQQQWFPDLSPEVAQLCGMHTALTEFLRTQQLLRLREPEAWLESDHDKEFMELWRSHRDVVHAAGEKVKLAAGAAEGEVGAGSTFAA